MPGTVTVPTGACSPSIPVPAGTLAVQEAPSSIGMIGCDVFPANRQVGVCTHQTVTVTVVPGDVSTETIITFVNGKGSIHDGTD